MRKKSGVRRVVLVAGFSVFLVAFQALCAAPRAQADTATISIGGLTGASERGEALFDSVCRQCHTLEADEPRRDAPALRGVFGRYLGAAGRSEFPYSEAMVWAGLQGAYWDAARLDAFLTSPQAEVPGTKKNFVGISDAQARADLIAFLKSVGETKRAPLALLTMKGDAELGRHLSHQCVTCHLPDGETLAIPPIGGWPEAEFKASLHAFRQNDDGDASMRMISKPLSDLEIASLATYFAAYGDQDEVVARHAEGEAGR